MRSRISLHGRLGAISHAQGLGTVGTSGLWSCLRPLTCPQLPIRLQITDRSKDVIKSGGELLLRVGRPQQLSRGCPPAHLFSAEWTAPRLSRPASLHPSAELSGSLRCSDMAAALVLTRLLTLLTLPAALPTPPRGVDLEH